VEVTWTHDGRYLILTDMADRAPWRLWAIPAEGGERRPLDITLTTRNISSLSFSGDGQHITFTGSQRQQELWVIRNLPQLQASR
jgi:dipeptidyl aminopeptidase/acylaminoacyl peptidase